MTKHKKNQTKKKQMILNGKLLKNMRNVYA